MPSEAKMDELYMDIAERVALMSYGRRLKVGAVIAKDNNIISYGWNGMPAGMDNDCEDEHHDGTITTKREVIHAESNSLVKLVSGGGTGAQGATLYTTWSPCFECSKLIRQAKIRRVVFRNAYRDMDGVKFLIESGVQVVQLHGDETIKNPFPATVPAIPQVPPERSPSLMREMEERRQALAQQAAASVVEPFEAAAPVPVVDATPEERLNSFQQPAEDEVAALLRAHEVSLRQAATPVPGAPGAAPVAAAEYVSSFL